MNILIFNEYTNNTFINSILIVVYLFIIYCGIYIITAKNPIVSVLYLILLFSLIACYLIQLTASFIGLSYLLVYVGAVSILFLFILMLINVRVSELVTDNNNSIPLSLFVIGIFTIIFNLSLMWNNDKAVTYTENKNIITTNELYNNYENIDLTMINEVIDYTINPSFSKIYNKEIDYNVYNAGSYSWDSIITSTSHINSIGNIIYTSYPILLLVTSIILLLAMIGSIVITVKK